MEAACKVISTTYTSSFSSLPQLFRQYAEFKDLALEDVMRDRASKLIASEFGNGVYGLYQAARKIAPSKEQLFAIPERNAWRIKRKDRPVFTLYETRRSKRGKTAGQIKEFRRKNKATGEKIKGGEINRRSAARGFHARGWLNANFLNYDPKTKLWKGIQSNVVLKLSGDVLEVSVANGTPMSAEVVANHGNYVQVVLDLQVRDMLDYVKRKMQEAGEKFVLSIH